MAQVDKIDVKGDSRIERRQTLLNGTTYGEKDCYDNNYNGLHCMTNMLRLTLNRISYFYS